MTPRLSDIPVLETERLTLSAPSEEGAERFVDFLKTDRSRFIGGPDDSYREVTRAYSHMAGLWVLRGYSAFSWALKDGTVIGHGGPWYPLYWPEPEFGWIIYDGKYEGQGYATEAMTVLRDWAWDTLGLTTCVAFIDPGNDASAAVANRLGGARDPETPNPFDDGEIDVWRFYPEGRA